MRGELKFLFSAWILFCAITERSEASSNATTTTVVIETAKLTQRRGASNTTHEVSNIVTQMPEQARPWTNNCTVIPGVDDIGQAIADFVSSGYKIVRLELSIKGDAGPLSDLIPGDMYSPFRWSITTGKTGQAMLMLKDNFDAMSIQSLGYGVGTIPLSLVQEPGNCLSHLSLDEVQNIIRHQILSNFGWKDNLPAETTKACSRHIKLSGPEKGAIVYRCCYKTVENDMICSEVKKSMWLHVLFILITLMQMFVILYSPLLLPEGLYSTRKIFTDYSYYPEEDESLELKIKKVTDRSLISRNLEESDIHSTARMTNFKEQLSVLKPNKVYTMYVNKMIVSCRKSKLLSEGEAHAGIMDFIKRFFCQCRMREDVKSVKPCCNANMCKMLPGNYVCVWHKCLTNIMRLVTVGIICIPLILRIVFYYSYEVDGIESQKAAVAQHDLSLAYNGSVLSYISPTHGVFIFTYVFLISVWTLFSITPNALKTKMKVSIWKCFSDMLKTKTKFAFGRFTSRMLWPLTRFGIFGFLVFPLWIIVFPFCLILLWLEVLPIVNLTLRYVVNFIYYTLRIVSPTLVTRIGRSNRVKNWLGTTLANVIVKDLDDKQNRSNAIVHVIALGTTIVTMWTVIFLVTECLSFFVECGVYTLIGFILNPGRVMRMISVIMLIGVYGHESFTGVQKTFASYCKGIHEPIQELFEEKIKEIAKLDEDEQECLAFRVKPLSGSTKGEKMKLVKGSEGHMKWKAPRLVLFFDKDDIPYIPKDLLKKSSMMSHFYCPGEMHMLYLSALWDFAKVMVFLFFVFIVIFAFGQTNNVSSGSQSIAALGSGMLPLFLRKLLFKAPEVNKKNLKWYNLLMNVVDKYEDRWHPVDIFLSHSNENGDKTERASDSGDEYDEHENVENAGNGDIKIQMEPMGNGDINGSYRELENTHLIPIEYRASRKKSTSFTSLGSETLLPEYFKSKENEKEEQDLVVFFGTDGEGNEVVEYYLPKKKEKQKEEVEVIIQEPFMDETLLTAQDEL